jgi:hypothetical protein
MPDSIVAALASDLKPSTRRIHRLIRRRSCSIGFVERLALPDADRLQASSGSIPQPVLAIAGNDCLTVRLAAVNDDAFGTSMARQGLAEQALGSLQVTVIAEEELNRVANAVDGAVQIRPATADLDVGFVDMALSGDPTLSTVEALEQQRREMHDPAVDRRMVEADATPRRHLFQVAQAEIVSQVPANGQEDHRPIEMAPFELKTLLKEEPSRPG